MESEEERLAQGGAAARGRVSEPTLDLQRTYLGKTVG